jgi:two-component system, OmpR family, sensor histidine kinase KdpD
MNRLKPELRRYGLAVSSVIGATAVFLPGRYYFAKGQWSLLYLLVIVFVAALSGLRAAVLAAVTAFLCWNFFLLPPYHTFAIADPKDWLSLFVFLVVGIIMGLQTARLRQREEDALARETETALLNRFSAHLVSELSVDEMADVLVSEVTQATGATTAALFVPSGTGSLAEIALSGADPLPPDSEVRRMVEWAYAQSKAIGVGETRQTSTSRPPGWPVGVRHSDAGFDQARTEVVLPLQTATKQVGVLYVGERPQSQPLSPSDARLLIAIGNLAAAFLERKQLQAIEIEADALHEADRLKSTFVSSVSHELKTPLASVSATVTNLLEGDVAWDEDAVRGELEAVQEDLNRLNNSIGALLDFSRLESAAWEPRKEWYDLGEILGTTISNIPEKQRSRVSFTLPEDLPAVRVDFQQMSRVLQNLLENALTYSGADAPVTVGASYTPDEIRIWVEDTGPGIPVKERERVFEKFYRGAASGRMPSGTGLGLAVAAEIVKSHGGKIWVEDALPHGARVVVRLPREVQ